MPFTQQRPVCHAATNSLHICGGARPGSNPKDALSARLGRRRAPPTRTFGRWRIRRGRLPDRPDWAARQRVGRPLDYSRSRRGNAAPAQPRRFEGGALRHVAPSAHRAVLPADRRFARVVAPKRPVRLRRQAHQRDRRQHHSGHREIDVGFRPGDVPDQRSFGDTQRRDTKPYVSYGSRRTMTQD